MYLSQDHPKIFAIHEGDFEPLALEIFRFQYSNNPVYRAYTDALHIHAAGVDSLTAIPFLPVRFFKSHDVQTTAFTPAAIFESSGTTGSINSRHLVKDTVLYKNSFTRTFELFYGPVQDWCIIGLLPSYLERSSSSLVYMVNELTRLSGHPLSGFYLDEQDKLAETLSSLENKGQKTLLIGVTFALLDLAEKYSMPLKHTVVMETGGMKGRRKEMIRQEVHDVLKRAFQLATIHSEYGMTELLSQAYSKGDGIFQCPPWMKILLRDEEDPLSVRPPTSITHQGAINIIDLANVYSCSFIATDDAGRLYGDGSFEVLGRLDNSDLRGCSLMVM
ncbi:MAG: acyl transferase [Chitinophagaceae bacterium]|nr:acyl transferase [Chitinophagaceae bacterium]